jgi:antitoxin component of MazEF toxin-antitoxin module
MPKNCKQQASDQEPICRAEVTLSGPIPVTRYYIDEPHRMPCTLKLPAQILDAADIMAKDGVELSVKEKGVIIIRKIRDARPLFEIKNTEEGPKPGSVLHTLIEHGKRIDEAIRRRQAGEAYNEDGFLQEEGTES